jgi:hypothetical protein
MTATQHGIVFTLAADATGFAGIEERCTEHGISTLADIRRDAAIPSEGEFSRLGLETITAEAGYGYRWLGDRFGDGPDERVPAIDAVCDEIAGLSEASTVVLLCSSAEPVRRHRAGLLAAGLAVRGLQVLHIAGDGVAEPHQDQLDW